MSANNLLHDSSSQGGSRREFEDIEGLIVKQQEQIEREQALATGEILTPAASVTGVARMPAQMNNEFNEIPSDLLAGILHESQADLKLKEAAIIPPELECRATPGAIRIQGIDGDHEEEEKEEENFEEHPMNRLGLTIIDESARSKSGLFITREGSIVKAVLIDNDEEDPVGPLIVAEEQTETTKNRRKLYMGLGLLLIGVAVIVGVAVAVNTSKKGKGGPDNGGVQAQGDLAPTGSPSFVNGTGTNVTTQPASADMTAGAFLEIYRGENVESDGSTVAFDFQTYHLAAQGNGLLEYLNRPDIALTIFAPAGRAFQNNIITTDFVSKYLSDSWVGHSRDLFLNFVVVADTPLFSKTIKDGSEFTTEAGNKIIIRSTDDDFAVITKNVSIPVKAHIQKPNIEVSNGVIHGLFDFYYPPWFNLTVFEVLEKANAERGDLTTLISLLEAAPDLKQRLMGREGPLTFFAPVDSSFSVLPTGLVDSAIANGLTKNLSLYKLIQNHMVPANYVAAFRAWERIPEGTKDAASTDQLSLLSDASGILEVVVVNNETTTINGEANVVEFDVFSEFGVVQIIDSLLMISTNFSL
jgi:uncharacterized surface protein with fasciclin (FAS1) repeats